MLPRYVPLPKEPSAFCDRASQVSPFWIARSVSGVSISSVPSGTSPRRDSPKPPTDFDFCLPLSSSSPHAPADATSGSRDRSATRILARPRHRAQTRAFGSMTHSSLTSLRFETDR